MMRIRQIRAQNPSPLTGSGTNTWIVGSGSVAVIDPGPALPAHLEAILATLEPGEAIAAILVTHPHRDHSELAPALSARSGAPVMGFGQAGSGRSPLMTRLLQDGLTGGGEGADAAFVPDRCLMDGEAVTGGDWELTALHTPGHMGEHLCFAAGETLFSGDHVMGWSTSLVSPPDGDMGAYMASLERLRAGRWSRFLPGHGEAIETPAERMAELASHRRQRETQILAALGQGPATPAELAMRVYAGTPASLLPAATRNTLAHLIDLVERNRIGTDGAPLGTARFHIL